MKTSELIEDLKKILKNNGDLDVVIGQYQFNDWVHCKPHSVEINLEKIEDFDDETAVFYEDVEYKEYLERNEIKTINDDFYINCVCIH